jgi:aminoglycoside phosphotransferase family enzyme/predicted kinase
MDLANIIEALSDATAYSHPVEKVEVRQTHISVVFLAGPYAYKVKKPVNLGFLDFSTLEKRHYFCEEEVRLNRRLAPRIYHGVVPLVRSATGLKVEGSGAVIEWAVKMERLPEDATLEKRRQRGEVNFELMQCLARTVASFHARAERGENLSSFGRFEVVANNARENFDQVAPQVGTTISQRVFDRLRALSEETLARLRPLIESRAARGIPRDTHGDLRLDHVYLFPDRKPPDDLVIIDCIEFSERLRFADPVADMAFLVMDLVFHGRKDLARAFSEEYFRAAGDEEGCALLSFYLSYRADVRGKVEGFKLLEKEISEAERAAALTKARGHWLLALGELEEPDQRPCLLLVGGLPGSGKSTLARSLTERAHFSLIRSDVVRKELAEIPIETPTPLSMRQAVYAPERTERTYAKCLRRAENLLFEGERVLVDATFVEERRRRDFFDLAARLAVPTVFLCCQATPEVVQGRLEHRNNDASDADWSIYQLAAQRWEELTSLSRPLTLVLSTDGTAEETLTQALGLLRNWSLLR